MELKNKSVLVIGLGISGITTIKTLHELGATITVVDSKNKEELGQILKELEGIPLKTHFGASSLNLDCIELIVKSPGVPPSNSIIKLAEQKNIEIISDIELAYRLSKSKNFIVITGSNGKTTTTHLVGEVFKKGAYKTFVVGNIGVGIMEKIGEIEENDIVVVEASSFQLENTIEFRPKVSLLLNISPDHLDWHGSYEKYIEAKMKVFKNQNRDDYTVLNYDDKIIKEYSKNVNGEIIWFSVDNILDRGIYVENNNIIINIDERIELMSTSGLKIIGKHNVENVLASIGIFTAMGVPLNIVKEVLENFEGIEHRLEFVSEINKRKFYNDSKGTNPESSIKAIEAIDEPIILIAGGYDKFSEFGDFVDSFANKVKALILMGATREKIKEAAISKDFHKIYMVDSMQEAVKLSYELSSEGDNILLSPACASWGMYKNFEARGIDFKNEVYSIGEK